MPTLLLLHTESPTLDALARLRAERGLPGDARIVVAASEPPRNVSAFDEVLPLPDFRDVRGTLASLETFAARARVDAIVPHAEYGLLAGSLFAAQRGLRALPPLAALLCTDKVQTRRALAAAGVPQPRFAVAGSADEVRRFARTLGGAGVVLKATASTMGRLVTRIAPDEDPGPAVERLRAALPAAPDVRRLLDFAALAGFTTGCDPTRQFLVEEWVEGTPLQSDGIIWGEELDFFGVTEQVVSPPPEIFLEGYQFPADIPGEIAGRVRETTRQAISALGLRDAAFCIEMRLRDGVPLVIEVNGRLGEDEGFPDLYQVHLGEYPIGRWIRLAAGGDPTSTRSGPNGAPRAAVAYVSWPRDGSVTSVPPVSEVAALAAAGIRAEVLVEPGTRLHEISHPESSPHLAYALATDPASSRAAAARAREGLARLRVGVRA
ncbi:MAG: ATP-grasp domain-containing protein [Planctomycetales bacterium]|nr:ATP-grasp domain-containing protein [Planctomycetales bacterium]